MITDIFGGGDGFYKYHGCGNDFVLIDEIKNADYRSLADRLCLADGNFENVIVAGHACNDYIADDFSYENIKEGLYALEQREYAKGIKYAQKHGICAYKLHYKNLQVEKEIAKWALYTYAKIMSNNLFVPIKTQDKKIEYAPFQTLAIYFIREGFDGIIYSSTVCPNAKNIVLFDKKYAVPFGNVSDYTFGPLSF